MIQASVNSSLKTKRASCLNSFHSGIYGVGESTALFAKDGFPFFRSGTMYVTFAVKVDNVICRCLHYIHVVLDL